MEDQLMYKGAFWELLLSGTSRNFSEMRTAIILIPEDSGGHEEDGKSALRGDWFSEWTLLK